MDATQERNEKLAGVRRLMVDNCLDAIWFRRLSSVAWLTAGAATYVSLADERGIASLLVTADSLHLITNNIEAPRLLGEEALDAAGCEWHIAPWHAPIDPRSILPEGAALGCDELLPGAIDLANQVSALRSRLSHSEQARMREVGRLCADAVQAAVMGLRPGMTEWQIAGILAEEALARGVAPIVNLIAVDERIYQYRHPLPTSNSLRRYAMVVLSGRRHGLIASITRLIHFGDLPAELEEKASAVAFVDATFIARSRPGARLDEVFRAGVEAYRSVGFPGEWLHHHQGGISGYEGREEKGTPTSTGSLHLGQACAWNPSIAGVKSEDTILIGREGNEIITPTPGLPTRMVHVEGQLIPRPAIWVRE